MITVRYAKNRGVTRTDWLTSHHTFSFAGYHDPSWMGFQSLRVINEDVVLPGRGFSLHPHENMEILSYVISGSLAHKDSLSHGSVISPGEVQMMSAGTGIKHSEYNGSQTDPVHFLQIWILPSTRGGTPGYQQQNFTAERRLNQLCLIASKDGADGSLLVKQDVSIFCSRLESGRSLCYELPVGRYAFLHVIRGEVTLFDTRLSAGDGAALSLEQSIDIQAVRDSELLLFDLGRVH